MITVNVLQNYQVVDRFVVDGGKVVEGQIPQYLQRTAQELTGGGENSRFSLERYILWTVNTNGNALSLSRGNGLQVTSNSEDPQPSGGFEGNHTVNPVTTPVMDSDENREDGKPCGNGFISESKQCHSQVYQEESDSTLTHEGRQYNLNQLLKDAHDRPTKRMKVSELAWVLDHTTVEEERIDKADPSAPVLVTESDGKKVVIDGAHRLAKAKRQGKRTIPARLVTQDDLDRALIRSDSEEEDLGDLITERSIEEVAPAIKKWSSVTKQWLKQQGSLDAARESLKTAPESLYDRLPSNGFQTVLEQNMILANLAGQLEVLEEDDRMDSLRVDARKPEWFRLSFQDALEWFRSKVNVPVDSYKDMPEGYHDWAYSIAHMTRADWLEAAKFLIDQAIEAGNSLTTFTKQWERLIGRQGWTTEGDRNHRIYTIFDTNIRSAYSTGRAKQMYDPEVLARRPLILWRWRDSPSPRPNHQALHNKAIAADSPFWQRCTFPAGFGCRCAGFSISLDYAERNKIEIIKTPPDPDTIAEPGFRYPLKGLTPEDRQAIIDSTLDRLSPNVKALVQKDLASRQAGN